MLVDVLKLIQEAFHSFIKEVEDPPPTHDVMVLDNIGLAEELGGSQDNLNGKIVVSIVNLQEEATLKNTPFYRQENGRTIYSNPPVNLNIFVLFSVLHRDQYETSLKRLSRVIEFFQWQKEFSFSTVSPESSGLSRQVKVYADLYSLTFEQANYLWGTLGGKQVPFVLYKLRLVTLDAEKPRAEGVAVGEREFGMSGG